MMFMVETVARIIARCNIGYHTTMPARPLQSDLTAITALGLLSERPRHPYEMQRLIRDRGKSFVTGLPRSLYHAIDRLTEAGLVEAGETTREGRRPERTVFAITDLGRETLEAWLADLLATPDAHEPSANYYAGLSLIAYLDPADAAAALRRRVAALDLEVAGTRGRMEGMAALLPRLFMLEEEQRMSAAEAERGFTQGLVDELESGALTWDREQFRRLAESGAEDVDLLRRLREAAAAQPDAG
jgi:DNA-binding PadR family transcriptional regulator